MARPNIGRAIDQEANLAERIRFERERREWSYEALAKRMTDEGCGINGSAIFKIEKGEPRRRITVDELVALSRVFETSVEDLLVPVAMVQSERAKELVAEILSHYKTIGDAVAKHVDVLVEFRRLEVDNPEVFEYVQFRLFTPPSEDDVVDLDDDDTMSDVQKAIFRLHAESMFHAKAIVEAERP